MKSALSLSFIGFLTLVPFSQARVIYGEDERVEVRGSTELQQQLAASAASMVSKNDISLDHRRSGKATLNQRTLREWLDSQINGSGQNNIKLITPSVKAMVKKGVTFCEGERFVDQPNPSVCSGFLIAPDLIVTAGHCAQLPTFCSDYRWVFGFEVDLDTNQAGVDIDVQNIYSCKKIISSYLSLPLGLDYALVQLDRRVNGRTPLKIQNNKIIEKNASLFVIGSPSGLPLKVAIGAKVRENLHPFYFNANLDTFQGNSGSAVFNAETGFVEGILVRGDEDFVPNYEKGCIEINRCADNKCRGEDVTRLTAIPEVGVQRSFYEAALNEDLKVLESIINLNVWIDFYTQDGQSAFMKAAIAGREDAANFLVSKGAQVNLQDATGNTIAHYLARKNDAKSLMMIKAFTKKGLNLEVNNNQGDTALLSAAKALNLPRVKALIKLGAKENALDLNQESILFFFMRSGNKKAVMELIALGVDPAVKNLQGKSIEELWRTAIE